MSVAELGDKTTGATNRLARIRKRADQVDAGLEALFASMEESRAECEAEGLAAQLKLSPMLEAAHRAWLKRHSGDPLPRVFTEVPEAPIGPELDPIVLATSPFCDRCGWVNPAYKLVTMAGCCDNCDPGPP